METKICKTCMIEKNINEFRKSGKYYRGDCRKCENKKCIKRNAKNKEHIKEMQKQYRKNNQQKIKEYREKHYNPKKTKEYNSQYYDSHKQDYANWHKNYNQKNKDKLRETKRNWEKANKDKVKKQQKKDYDKRMSNPIKKMEHQMRNMINCSFRRTKYIKNKKLKEIVGLDCDNMINYLLETYKNNYGYEWDKKEPVHIDHIMPISLAKNEDDVIKLCHYTNLQLLKAKDNLQKGNKTNWTL